MTKMDSKQYFPSSDNQEHWIGQSLLRGTTQTLLWGSKIVTEKHIVAH